MKLLKKGLPDEAFLFTAHGFSENGQWLIGISDRRFARVELDTSSAQLILADSLSDEDAIFTPTINNSGSSVALAGANFWKLEVYERGYV